MTMVETPSSLQLAQEGLGPGEVPRPAHPVVVLGEPLEADLEEARRAHREQLLDAPPRRRVAEDGQAEAAPGRRRVDLEEVRVQQRVAAAEGDGAGDPPRAAEGDQVVEHAQGLLAGDGRAVAAVVAVAAVQVAGLRQVPLQREPGRREERRVASPRRRGKPSARRMRGGGARTSPLSAAPASTSPIAASDSVPAAAAASGSIPSATSLSASRSRGSAARATTFPFQGERQHEEDLLARHGGRRLARLAPSGTASGPRPRQESGRMCSVGLRTARRPRPSREAPPPRRPPRPHAARGPDPPRRGRRPRRSWSSGEEPRSRAGKCQMADDPGRLRPGSPCPDVSGANRTGYFLPPQALPAPPAPVCPPQAVSAASAALRCRRHRSWNPITSRRTCSP